MSRSLLILLLACVFAGSIALIAFGQTTPAAPPEPVATTEEAPTATTEAPETVPEAPETVPAALETAPAGQETPPPATPGTQGNAPAAAPFGAPFQTGAPPMTMPDRPIDLAHDKVAIAFNKADLLNVLNFLSMATGIPIIVDAEVKGTVTINSMKEVSLPLAYEVINSALRARGYTMIGTLQDKMIRVETLQKAVADQTVVQMGADYTQIGTSDKIITQVVPLANISAVTLQAELRPLVGNGQASIMAESNTNTLIVTDTEGNVRRLLQIIGMLEGSNTPENILNVDVYQCQYANAAALVASLEKVFGVSSTPIGTQPNQQNQQPGRPGMRPPNGPDNQPSVQTDQGLFSLKGELHLAADDRTNAIIISGSKEKIELVKNLAAKLDKNITSEVKARVFPLKFADATMVASQLNSMFDQPQGGSTTGRNPFFGGGRQQTTASPDSYASLKRNIVVADVRTNSVVVTATEQNMKQFEELVTQLDTPNLLSDVARTFQLKYANAVTVATTLTNLFRGNTRGGSSFRDILTGNTPGQGDPIGQLRNITVVADQKTNTLLITGPPQVFTMVESIIAQLDRRTPQVFIQVAIVDVTLDDTNKFGIEWQWANGDSTVHSIGPNFGLADETLGLKYSIISNNLKALLHALTTSSNVRVYSTPSITTADNVAASISIGQDVPFVTSSEETSSGNIRQTVDFKNVSIALNVTPHVTPHVEGTDDLISLDVQQTINELIGREVELNAPIIANRQAKTTVMVKDGQTIVIGGIIKENTEEEKKAVPILSKIPLIGEAFKSRTNTKTKSELMVFLTPRILQDDASVDQRTETERNKLTNPPPPMTDMK